MTTHTFTFIVEDKRKYKVAKILPQIVYVLRSFLRVDALRDYELLRSPLALCRVEC